MSKKRALIGLTDDDKSEGCIGPLHSVDGLCDISTLVRVPLLLGDGTYRTYCRLIEVSSDGKLNAMPFTVVDDLYLIGGAIGSESADLLSSGHLPDAVFDKGTVSCSRGFIALSEFISYYEAVFREMAYDRHIVWKAFIGHCGCLLLGLNAGELDIEGAAGEPVIFYDSFQKSSTDLLKAGEVTIGSHLSACLPERARLQSGNAQADVPKPVPKGI
jgi:hypothetical protein